MRDSLEEERRAAILERVECELELGRHADLVGELRHLLAQYPLDETFIAHQMTALYGSGRPGEALSLYRDTRSRLIEEQGTEPGPAAVRTASAHPAAATPSWPCGSPASGRAGRHRPDTLPPETAEFVGRDEELEPAHRGARRRAPRSASSRACRGGQDRAGDPRRPGRSSGQYPDGTLYLNLHTHDPGRPPLDAGRGTAPAAADADRAGRADPGRDRRAGRAVAGPAEPPPGRRDPRRRGRHDQIRPLLPVAGRVPDPDHHPAQAARLSRRPRADPRRAGRRRRDHAVPAGRGRPARPTTRTRWPRPWSCADGCRSPSSSPPAGWRRTTRPGCAEPGRGTVAVPALLGGTGAASPELMPAFDLSYRALEPDHQRFFRRLGVSPCAHVSLQAAAALGGGTLAEAEKALATLLDHHLLAPGPGRPVPLPRPHPRIRGRARRARGPRAGAAAGRRPGCSTTTCTPPTRPTGCCIRSGAGRRCRSARLPAAQPARWARQEDAAGWLDSEWRNILQAAQHAGRHEWKQKCADLDPRAGRLRGDQGVLGRGDRGAHPGPAGLP